jgi:methylaspartate mutase sigma subunit
MAHQLLDVSFMALVYRMVYSRRSKENMNTSNQIALDPLRKKFLVSSISSDSHTWNLVFLQMLIEEYGHQVINLGACVPQEFLIEQCLKHRPDMLVISSVNGHGHIEGTQLIRAIRQMPELRDLPVIIGGKLGTRGIDNMIYTDGLLEAGFDAVFDADSGIDEFTRLLEPPTQLQLEVQMI